MGRFKPVAPLIVTLFALSLFSLSSFAAPQKSWGVGIMSWPEQIQVTDSLGRNFDATAQFYTPSVHYGNRIYRQNDGFLYEVYGFYGKADIQADLGLTYFQKRVSVYGIGGAVGWYARPEGKQVNIGFSLPIQVRQANWAAPTDGGDVNKRQLFAIGAVLDARWRLTSELALNQRIGAFLGYKSALWMMNIEWTL